MTGWQGPSDYFRFVEREAFDPSVVEDVLRGRRLGVVFRDVVPAEALNRLVERFWASPLNKRREHVEAPGNYLGTYHFHKTTEQYLADSAEVAPEMHATLDFPGSPWRWFQDDLRSYFARQGVRFRLAEKDGRVACPATIRSWDAVGDFALLPHEDYAQCREPGQADFEIQQVLQYRPCGVNFCLENGDGGRLVVWNIQPDDETRTRHGSYYAGAPYPPATMVDIQSVRLDLSPGDLYVFNAAHVHAVERNRGNRTTLSCLMGLVDDANVVVWT
ncbi:hypothetical protein ACIA47_17510 [Micromonospora sp. NPDC051227]|uniref:2OG-Fe(II)-dependent halogenase WelO5 family protein n=1 Tax=Micromonospora sp. NPDC051227 TaxID=3364285 RepID=UPI0037AFC294